MNKRARIGRNRLLRRAGLTLFLLVAGVLLLRGAWGVLAETRLKRMQTKMAAAVRVEEAGAPSEGTPASILVGMARDFQPGSFRSLGFTGTTILPPLLDIPFSPMETDKLKTIITTNEAVCARLEGNRAPQEAWRVPFDQKVAGRDAALGDQFRLILDLCIARSMLEHSEGRDDQAIRSLGRAMTVDRVLSMHQSQAAHQLLMYLRARVVSVMEQIGPELKLDAGASRGEKHSASLEDVRGLIKALLDDADFQRQGGVACREQIVAFAGGSTAMDERPEVFKPRSVSQVNWFLRPMLVDEQRRALVKAARWLEVVESPNYENYRQKPWEANDLRLSQAVMSATDSFDGQWFRQSFAHFRALVDARMAATLLAARWREVEEGAPASAGEKLVPQYLPRVAGDPFAADGRPLRYRLDAGGPTLWSVGANGIDDGGAIHAVARGRSWEQPDLVYGYAWWVMRSGMTAGPATPASVPAATAPAMK